MSDKKLKIMFLGEFSDEDIHKKLIDLMIEDKVEIVPPPVGVGTLMMGVGDIRLMGVGDIGLPSIITHAREFDVGLIVNAEPELLSIEHIFEDKLREQVASLKMPELAMTNQDIFEKHAEELAKSLKECSVIPFHKTEKRKFDDNQNYYKKTFGQKKRGKNGEYIFEI